MKSTDPAAASLAKHRSLTAFFVKNEALLRLWEGAASGVSLINSFLILSALTVYQFGLYQLVLSFIAIVGGLAPKFADGAVSIEMRHAFGDKQPDVAKKIFREYVFVRLGLAVLFALTVFFGANLVAGRYGADIGLFVRIVSVLLVVETLVSIEKVFFKSIFSFRYFAVPAAREVVKLVLLIPFFFLGTLGIADVLAIHVVGWMGALLVTSLAIARPWREALGGVTASPLPVLKKIFARHGKWLFAGYAFARLTKNTTPWFIKIFVSTEAVALYAVAVNLVSFIEELFPINMMQMVFLAKYKVKKELANIFRRSFKYVTWIGLGLLAAGFFAVPPIINLILPKYNVAMPLFKLMLLVLPTFGFYKLLKGMLSVLREYRILALRIVTEILVVIGVLVVSLPLIGVYGAALSYIAVYLSRIFFMYPALIKTYPHLIVRIRELFEFDRYDRLLLGSLWRQSSGIIGRHLARFGNRR